MKIFSCFIGTLGALITNVKAGFKPKSHLSLKYTMDLKIIKQQQILFWSQSNIVVFCYQFQMRREKMFNAMTKLSSE